jgi:hypothetical protein
MRNSLPRLALVLFAPLILLAIDFYLYPLVFSQYASQRAASVQDVLKNQVTFLGIFHAHKFFISVDDIFEPNYLSFISHEPNGLLISTFVSESENNKTSVGGALQSATVSQLKSVSMQDSIALQDKLSQLDRSAAAADLALNIPKDKYQRFPIDRVFIVILPEGHDYLDRLKSGINRSLIRSQRAGLKNVVIPPLGVRYDDHGVNSVALPDFFQTLFSAVPTADHPDNIYLSLYKLWPTFELEAAVQAINSVWQAAVIDEGGDYVLYRRDVRLVLIALVMCLIVCSFRVRYSVKNFLIIAISFVGLGLGANKWVEPLVAGDNYAAQLAVQVVTLIIFALAFPIIVTWNPRNLFGGDK